MQFGTNPVPNGTGHRPRSFIESVRCQTRSESRTRSLVRVQGVEPCTSFLSGKRSTGELHTHFYELSQVPKLQSDFTMPDSHIPDT